MIVQLPNGEKRTLPEDISVNEKCTTVDSLLKEFEERIFTSWNTQQIKYFLEGLSNYIVWHKEDKNKHDKYVMSKNKILKLNKFDDKNIPFSFLSKTEKQDLGIEDMGEEY